MPATQTTTTINQPAPEFKGIGGNIIGGQTRQLIGPGGRPRSYADVGGPTQQLTQMNAPEMMGYQMGVNTAMGPNAFPGYAQNYAAGLYGPQSQMAQRNYLDTMSGKYMSPESNPYLKGAYNQAANAASDQYRTSAMPALNAAFSGGGALGGSAHRAQAGKAAGAHSANLTNLANQMYGGAYQQERGIQSQMAGDVMNRAQGLAPQLGALRGLQFQDADILRQLGGGMRQYQDQRNQQDMANRMAEFQYAQGVYPQLANMYATITQGTGMQTGRQDIPMLWDSPGGKMSTIFGGLGSFAQGIGSII